MENNRFRKAERLCSLTLIGKLFPDGKTFLVYPVKVVWIPIEKQDGFPAQIVFSVSKRNFKRAVKRNLIKRRMKEAYRLNKNSFYSSLNLPEDKALAIMMIYVGKEILPYEKISRSMQKALDRLIEKTSPDQNQTDNSLPHDSAQL
ncbi:MAG: ribonuclease P protein component [Bacteroidota bacterium]|nr:ribonuclease P protein component [Bacteroidota bacterium]